MAGNVKSGRVGKKGKKPVESKPAMDMPAMPRKLTKKKFWEMVVNILIKRGTYNDDYAYPLMEFADCYDNLQKYKRDIKKFKTVYEGTTDRGAKTLKQNPAIKLYQTEIKTFLDFCRKFGLTPLDLKNIPTNKQVYQSVRDQYKQ